MEQENSGSDVTASTFIFDVGFLTYLHHSIIINCKVTALVCASFPGRFQLFNVVAQWKSEAGSDILYTMLDISLLFGGEPFFVHSLGVLFWRIHWIQRLFILLLID